MNIVEEKSRELKSHLRTITDEVELLREKPVEYWKYYVEIHNKNIKALRDQLLKNKKLREKYINFLKWKTKFREEEEKRKLQKLTHSKT